MALMIDAVFDGRAFLPVEPITLEPNTKVKISIQANIGTPYSFLSVAQSLNLDGPPDWSVKLDEYLYGGKSLNGN